MMAFRDAIASSDLKGDALVGVAYFRGSFNAGYRETYRPEEALDDVAELAALDADNLVRMRSYRLEGDGEDVVRAKNLCPRSFHTAVSVRPDFRADGHVCRFRDWLSGQTGFKTCS